MLDRFHVIRWFAAGLTAVRRDVQRRPEGSVPAFDRDVFRSRFLLMRRPDKLAAAEQARLDALFAAHPRLKAAWEALGELHNLYLATDRKGALEALDRFADIYGTGDIPEFSSIVDTFLAWHNQILDWHHAGRPSNGRIEGTNNLLQVLRRRAHGFTNYANFEAPRSPPNMNPAEPSSPNPKKRRRLNLMVVVARWSVSRAIRRCSVRASRGPGSFVEAAGSGRALDQQRRPARRDRLPQRARLARPAVG